MLLPGSMFALDILGGTSESTGLGFDDGDADRPCRPIPGTLNLVPWLAADGVAQVQLSMYEADGRPFFADPRNVLARAGPLPPPQPDPGGGDRVRVLPGRRRARSGRAAAPSGRPADAPPRIPYPDQLDAGSL